MLMTSGRREGALAIPSPGIGLSLNELSIPLRKNDYPITEFEAKWIFFAKSFERSLPRTPSFGRRFPRFTRARWWRAPMQGLILNESSYALNLISKGNGPAGGNAGPRGARVSGRQGTKEVCKRCANVRKR